MVIGLGSSSAFVCPVPWNRIDFNSPTLPKTRMVSRPAAASTENLPCFAACHQRTCSLTQRSNPCAIRLRCLEHSIILRSRDPHRC